MKRVSRWFNRHPLIAVFCGWILIISIGVACVPKSQYAAAPDQPRYTKGTT